MAWTKGRRPATKKTTRKAPRKTTTRRRTTTRRSSGTQTVRIVLATEPRAADTVSPGMVPGKRGRF